MEKGFKVSDAIRIPGLFQLYSCWKLSMLWSSVLSRCLSKEIIGPISATTGGLIFNANINDLKGLNHVFTRPSPRVIKNKE